MTITAPAKGRVLSVFSLVMINVIAVDSLRTLPLSAGFGLALISYYVLFGICFFIPVALITAELATTWPKRGGIYIWVREALGTKAGFLVVWLQWVYNLVWYPAILATISLIVAHLFNSAVLASPAVTMVIVLTVFWLATLGNCYGMELSSLISAFCTWAGTLLPMFLIIILGCWWLGSGQYKEVADYSWHDLLPNVHGFDDLAIVASILFGLMGIEMSAVHAQEVKDPKRDYPIALKYSVVIILLTLALSSVAVAVVVPKKELNIVTGVVQAFEYFFAALGIPWLVPIIAVAIIIGSVGAISAWVIGPTKALLVAAQEDNLPKFFAKTNKYGVPVNILLVQGIIVSILSTLYIALPTVESAYLLLTQLTAMLALFMHLLLFVAAIRLRYKYPDIHRPYKIPGGNMGMWFVCLLGGSCSLVALILGFLPPSQIAIDNKEIYQSLLLMGLLAFCLPAYFIHKRRK